MPEALTPWKGEILWRLFVDAYNRLTIAYGDELIDSHEAALASLGVNRPHDITEAEIAAFLEGRIDEQQLHNFRQELAEGGGLSSYPHPYLMRDFWQFPTVSMGLGPLLSIYQARFNRYLRARGLSTGDEPKVWAFVGDGETDEPETLGSLTLASRENLDNLIWVVNCNLQRLDGPVRGNGKIIQELEAAFQGAGWNVIKVIWGSAWDELLAADKSGLLIRRMEEAARRISVLPVRAYPGRRGFFWRAFRG